MSDFLNSIFCQLLRPTTNLRKQVFAFDMYHNLNELIEDEIVHRTLYIQERDAFRDMDMGFIHCIKSALRTNYDYIMNMQKSETYKLQQLGKDIDTVIENLTKYIKIYRVENMRDEISISDIKNRWNKKCEEHARYEKTITFVRCDDERDKRNFSGSIEVIDMIFEEFIYNAINKATREQISLTLSFNVENDNAYKNIVIFSISNIGSSIPDVTIKKWGKNFFRSLQKEVLVIKLFNHY